MSAPLPSFLLPNRCVLLIMDDGVSVYRVASKQSQFLVSIMWRDPAFEEKLADAVNRSGGSSVMILNDAVEQHYRKEKVPVITMFDRANIVQRRLNVAFPNFSMRAAKVLKEGSKALKTTASNPKAKETTKGDLYLFAAVPSTESFGRVMLALQNTDAQISGYGLLPVESTSLVDALVKKIAQKSFGVGTARWSILISQHRGGGLRQIVVRDGELALTRVTPVVEPSPENPGAWAADVSQELQATLSYLSRFGYTPEDGLDILVVGDPTYTEALESMIYAPCNYMVLKVAEAAKHLGLKLTPDADEHFSEVIHSGWVGSKITLDLPLASRDIQSLQQPRMVAQVVLLVGAVAACGALGMAADEALKMYRASVNLEVAMIQKQKIENIYQEELLRKQKMGIDVPLVKGSLAISDSVNASKVDPLKALDLISRELETIRLDKFEFVNRGNEPIKPKVGDPEVPARDTHITLYVSFAGSIKPKEGNEEIDKLVARLNEKMKDAGYEASVSKPLQDLSFRGVAESEFGYTATQRKSDDRYQAEIVVKRVAKNG